MPRKAAMRASVLGIVANMCLLVIKATATSLSDSLTIFSETLNSLSDVVASAAILACVHWAWTLPDKTHPFGHRRAEPLAGLLVSIFAGILGFEVVRTAVLHLWRGDLPTRIGPYPIIALCFTAVVKTGLAGYFWRRGRQLGSPALRATAVDCRNDVLIAVQGLLAIVVADLRIPLLDGLAAVVVGVYILFTAVQLGIENVDFLMGKAPDAETVNRIRTAAEAIPGVGAISEIKGHYVGTFVHVELTARVDGTLSTIASHGVSEEIRAAVEQLDNVDRVFVHIEPMKPRRESSD